jgi:predicted site-specific integrase-resolvase
MALIDTKKAAEILGVTKTTLESWRWKGIGPEYVSLPKAVRYDERVIREYIANNTRKPSVQAFMEERRALQEA